MNQDHEDCSSPPSSLLLYTSNKNNNNSNRSSSSSTCGHACDEEIQHSKHPCHADSSSVISLSRRRRGRVLYQEQNNINTADSFCGGLNTKTTNISTNSAEAGGTVDDEILPSHLDTCDRASKRRDRIVSLMHGDPLSLEQAPTTLNCFKGRGNLDQQQENKYSITRTSTSTRRNSRIDSFDKERFQKLMIKRQTLAQLRESRSRPGFKSCHVDHLNLCSDSHKDRVFYGNGHAISDLSTLQSTIQQKNPSYNEKTRDNYFKKESVLNHHEDSIGDEYPREIPCRRRSHGSFLGHIIHPTSQQALVELASRHNRLSSTTFGCTRVESTETKNHIMDNQQTLHDSKILDESLQCITVVEGEEGNSGSECYDSVSLTVQPKASFLDTLEYSSEDSEAPLSMSFANDNCDRGVSEKDPSLIKGCLVFEKRSDKCGADYLSQLQTLIGMKATDCSIDSNLTSTSVSNKEENMSTVTSLHAVNHEDLRHYLNVIDHDVASAVSSQITLDYNLDGDNCFRQKKKLKGAPRCSLLRLCMMAWFVSIFLVSKTSYSHEKYHVSSWLRRMTQVIREVFDFHQSHFDISEDALVPKSESTLSGDVWDHKEGNMTLYFPTDFQTTMPCNHVISWSDNFAMYNRSMVAGRGMHYKFVTKHESTEIVDTCGIDVLFYQEMTNAFSAKETYNVPKKRETAARYDVYDIDVLFYHAMTKISPAIDTYTSVTDTVVSNNLTHSFHDGDAKKIPGIAKEDQISNQSSESDQKTSKLPFWSRRENMSFITTKSRHLPLFQHLEMIRNQTRRHLSKCSSSPLHPNHVGVLHPHEGEDCAHNHTPSPPEIQKPMEYLLSRQSLDEDDDVSIMDTVVDFLHITIKAWKHVVTSKEIKRKLPFR